MLHLGNNYFYKLDFAAFFPHITRNIVFNFFKEKLEMSSDTANIMANLTTIDLNSCKREAAVDFFLQDKKISSRNHLISGSPSSQVLSYLVNLDMFDKLYAFANNNNISMTIYVDDIFFSSKNRISNKMIVYIKHIISRYGYELSSSKEKYCTTNYPKEITGIIIDKNGKIKVKNSLSKNIYDEYMHLLGNNIVAYDRKHRLQGLCACAYQIEKYKFRQIHKYAFKK